MDLGMKHARVRITADGREAEIHPMYDMWANASFIERINVTISLRQPFLAEQMSD